MGKKLKKYEYRFVNRYKQHTSFRIEVAPFFIVVKQMKLNT